MILTLVLVVAVFIVAIKYTIGFWVVLSILAVWTLFGWKKLLYRNWGIYIILGRRTKRPVLGEGWNIVPLKGLIKIDSVDGTKKNYMISPTDIWTRANDSEAGEVQLDVAVNVEYEIVDPYLFFDVGGLNEVLELLTSQAQQVLRREFRKRSEDEALSEDEQSKIKDVLEEHIEDKSSEWGLNIIDVFLSKVNRNDPDVRKDVQLYRREKAQQRAEKIQTQTVILQAEINLEAAGLVKGTPEFTAAIPAEIERIKAWRINELSAEKGKAVVIPIPIDLFKKGES